MTRKRVLRLYAYGDVIVQVEGEEIIQTFDLDREILTETIQQVIEENIERPNEIFKLAVERITGEYFGDVKRKLVISEIEYSLYDQSIYRFCESIIFDNTNFKKKQELKLQMKKEYNMYLQKEREILGYLKEDRNKTGKHIKNHRADLAKKQRF